MWSTGHETMASSRIKKSRSDKVLRLEVRRKVLQAVFGIFDFITEDSKEGFLLEKF